MTQKETPTERRARLLKQLEKGKKTREENQKKRAELKALGKEIPPELELKPRKKPVRNLDKIVREVLSDEEIVDKIVQRQPEAWQNLPAKTGGYIIATTMMVKAMGGDIKAAEWIRKTGYGDKVSLDSEGGFFQKDNFTIKIVPPPKIEEGVKEAIEVKKLEG